MLLSEALLERSASSADVCEGGGRGPRSAARELRGNWSKPHPFQYMCNGA